MSSSFMITVLVIIIFYISQSLASFTPCTSDRLHHYADVLKQNPKISSIGWKRSPLSYLFSESVYQRLYDAQSDDIFLFYVPTTLPVVNASYFFIENWLKYMKVWTPEFQSGLVLSRLDNTSSILYTTLHSSIPFTKGRDICYLQCYEKLEDGSYVSALQSIDDPICPVNPNLVRMKFFNVAHISEQVDGTTKVAIMDMEITGGYMPKWLFNLIMPMFLIKEIHDLKTFLDSQ